MATTTNTFTTADGRIIEQEFDACGRHRLINPSNGEHTRWAPYTTTVMLYGMVGHSAYYGERESICTPLEFCHKMAFN